MGNYRRWTKLLLRIVRRQTEKQTHLVQNSTHVFTSLFLFFRSIISHQPGVLLTTLYVWRQIANVVFETVDAGTVNTAIAGDTLFIHGRSIEGGSASLLARRKLGAEAPQPDIWCEPSCGNADAITAGELPDGVFTACDASCRVGGRFGGYLCGAGDSRKFGGNCRLCYTDQEKALRAEEELRGSGGFSGEGGEARHVIMCDTMRPPAALACSPECARKKDTVRKTILSEVSLIIFFRLCILRPS